MNNDDLDFLENHPKRTLGSHLSGNWHWILLGLLLGANLFGLMVFLEIAGKAMGFMALIGAVGGIVLSTLILSISYYSNGLIRTEEEVMHFLNCDVIAVIPKD